MCEIVCASCACASVISLSLSVYLSCIPSHDAALRVRKEHVRASLCQLCAHVCKQVWACGEEGARKKKIKNVKLNKNIIYMKEHA
jgi:hypothetical protein